jgi:hypothetical protein
MVPKARDRMIDSTWIHTASWLNGATVTLPDYKQVHEIWFREYMPHRPNTAATITSPSREEPCSRDTSSLGILLAPFP